MFRVLVGSVVAVGVLAIAGCSSEQPVAPPSSSPTPSAPSTPSAAPTKAQPPRQGKEFDVKSTDLTIHSFHSDPQTKSGGFRMNCYPLWRDVETAKGQYNWAVFDQNVANQKAWGAKDLLYSFCGTPEWAAAGAAKDPSVEVFGPRSAVPPKKMAYFEDYVRAVVKRYKGTIGAYEVWNEASSPQFWQGTPKQMVDMTEAVRKIVKQEDPDALVTMASVQTHRVDYFRNFGIPYLRELGKAGWPFDVYNGHFYPTGQGGPAARRAQIAMFRRAVAQLKGPDKPLWDTEVNYYAGVPGGEPNGRITGPRAAAWAVRTYLDGWRLGLRRNYWYFATPEYNAFPGIQTRPGDPATRGLATFADWVVGTRFNGCEQQERLINCVFSKDGKDQYIAWAESVQGDDKLNMKQSYPLDGAARVCSLPDNTCEKTKTLIVDESPVLILPNG